MDAASFFTASRILVVAGKGGVGKTVVSAALATAAARSGRSSLLLAVEGTSALPGLFGRESLAFDEVELAPGDPDAGRGRITGRAVTPDDALVEWLEDHGLKRVAKRMAKTGVLEIVATAVPGIKDILVLGKIKALERDDPADVLIVDAPAAGHAVTFLRSATALLDTARSGPIRTQSEQVARMLSRPKRTRVLLVTLPEETPVNELIETAFRLEDEVGVALAPVVVNAVTDHDPALDVDPADLPGAPKGGRLAELTALLRFRRERAAMQQAQRERMAAELPLPQIVLPDVGEVGPESLEALADALLESIEELA